MVAITLSQAPTASSASCPGWKVLLAAFPFVCTLSPSLPMAASQDASAAALVLPLCDNGSDSVLLGFIISGNFPATLNSQAGGKSFQKTHGHELCISSTKALYSVLPWE